MRIELETGDVDNGLMAGPGDVYAPEISSAGNEFAYSIYKHSKLPLRLFEAARMATAVINGCIICKNWRAHRDVPQLGIDTGVIRNGDVPNEEFYLALLSDDQSLLSEREQLAVEYAKAMGTSPKELAVDDKFWERMTSTFTDAEITDLTYCVAGWMGLGRVFHVLGMDRNCAV